MATQDKNQDSSDKDENKVKNKSSSSETEKKDEKKETSAKSSSETKGSSKKGEKKSKSGSKKEDVSASAKKEDQGQEDKTSQKEGESRTINTVSQGPSYQYGTGQENQSTETTGPSDFDQFRQSKQYEGPRQGHGFSQTGISQAPYGRGEYPRGGYPQSRYTNAGYAVGSSQWGRENRDVQQSAERGQHPYASAGARQRPSDYSQQGRQFRDPSSDWQRTGQTSDSSWWDSGTRQQQNVYRGETGYPYRENVEGRNQQNQRGMNMYPQEPASERQRRNFAEGSQYPYEGNFGAHNTFDREALERADLSPGRQRETSAGGAQQSYGGGSQYPYGGNFGERSQQGQYQHQKSEMEGKQYPYGGNFGERSSEGNAREEQKGPEHTQNYQADQWRSEGYRTPGWVKNQQKEEQGGAGYGQTDFEGQPQQTYGGGSQYPYGGNYGERSQQEQPEGQKSQEEGRQYPYGGNYGERSPQAMQQEAQKGPGQPQGEIQGESQELQSRVSHSPEFRPREFEARDFHSQGPSYHQPTGRMEGGAYRTPGWVENQRQETAGGADYGQGESRQQSPGWDQNQFRTPNQIINQNPNTMRSEERDYRRDRDYDENRYQDYGRERNRRGDMDYEYGAGMSGQSYGRGGRNENRESWGYSPDRGEEASPIQRGGSNYDQDMYGPTGRRDRERDYGRYGSERDYSAYSSRGYAGDRDYGRNQGYSDYYEERTGLGDRNRNYGEERYGGYQNMRSEPDYDVRSSRYGSAGSMGRGNYDRDRSYGAGRDYESDRSQSAMAGGTNYGSYGSSMSDASRYGYDRDYQGRNSYYDRGGAYDRDRDLGYRASEEDRGMEGRRGGEWASSGYDRDRNRNYGYSDRYENRDRDRY